MTSPTLNPNHRLLKRSQFPVCNLHFFFTSSAVCDVSMRILPSTDEVNMFLSFAWRQTFRRFGLTWKPCCRHKNDSCCEDVTRPVISFSVEAGRERLSRGVITFQSAFLTKKRLETRTVKKLKRQVIVVWKDLSRWSINPKDGCRSCFHCCISARLRSAMICVIPSAHYQLSLHCYTAKTTTSAQSAQSAQ